MPEKDLKSEIIQALRENADSHPETIKKSQVLKIISLTSFISLCIVAFLYFSTSIFSSDPITGPYGKIISPAAGSLTGQTVKVIGETQNLEPGQYVWLAVDKPDLGLCWPKAPRIQPNTKFKTTIYEGGPKEPYTLSLYAVNKTINDQWQDWIGNGIFGGLPMPPDKR
ncbi:MAG: hypothetical protein GXP56_02200, partial [Deltaproteobacteria bacterium]|nr:hypothetical protein [Deltaproteobacteria bacterium]